jgi:predicted lipoprotein with Yx(FWY)xxD motif
MNHRLPRSAAALTVTLGAILLAAVLAATGRAGASARSAGSTAVDLRKTALGSILVDSRGHSLYLFEADRKGASMCNTDCASFWPPLTTRTAAHAGKGINASLLGLTHKRNGVRQVTYAGHPLYTFVGDKRPGQTTGEALTNFGAEWYVLAASGRKIDKDFESKAQAPSAGSGGGQGYGSRAPGSGSGW